MPSTPRTAGRSRWGRSWTSRWRPRNRKPDRLLGPPQPQLERCASPWARVGEAQVAAHAAGEAAAQGQTQADSRSSAGGAGRGFVKRPEEPTALGAGDAGSSVLEAQYQMAA